MKKSLLSLVLLVALAAPSFAMAQDAAAVPGHPRVNEIEQRLDNQQQRIQNGVNAGQINAQQAVKDEARDAKVSQELATDEAKHNGHITKVEQAKMNRQLNHASHAIHRQRHGAAATTAAPTAN